MTDERFDATRYSGRMVTIGNPDKHALRITMGRLSRKGRWHGWQPCIFLIVNGRRR